VTATAFRRLAGAITIAVIGLVAWTGAMPAAQATGVGPAPIVLYAVPGLTWADVVGMPHLRELAARSSVGELSVKTRSSITRCGTGMLAVSAGNRTSGPPPGCGLNMSTWQELRQGNNSSRFAARVGALGETLQTAGVKTVAVGQGAVPMLANDAGRVDAVVPSIGEAARLGGRSVYAGLPAAEQLVDDRIATVEQHLPPGATLMVAGISDPRFGHSVLHTLVLSGPGWTSTTLRSSAAGRAPYVQLIDVAPTLLTAAGVKIPEFMVGRPMQKSGKDVPPIATFIDDNQHAVLQRTLGQRVFLTIGITAIVMMLLAAAPGRLAHGIAAWLARLVAPAPAMVFIANAFPWWRWGRWQYGGLVLAGCVIIALATTPIRRRFPTGALIAVPVFSFAALALDQITGSTLQLSAPLGDSPLVAGRFSGMGNIDFAILASSGLLIAGIVGGRMPTRTRAVLAAGAIAVTAIVVDGAPQLGNDIGGVLALVPATLVMLAILAEIRLTKWRVLAVAVTTVVVAVGVALADYSRPPTAQTHVGRFVGQVLHGGAGVEVRRKFDASMATFGLTIGTFVVGFSIGLAIIGRHRIRAALARVPGATAAGVAVAVLGGLGVALNDSGVVIAAMASIVGTSAFYGGGLRSASTARPAADPAAP
jgi:hypothetical protein